MDLALVLLYLHPSSYHPPSPPLKLHLLLPARPRMQHPMRRNLTILQGDLEHSGWRVTGILGDVAFLTYVCRVGHDDEAMRTALDHDLLVRVWERDVCLARQEGDVPTPLRLINRRP